MFASNSRYVNVPDTVYTNTRGQSFPYKLLRLTPNAPTLQLHAVVQEDRLDMLAFSFYGDPEQFWRICDANVALRPDDLLVIGAQLQIPLVQR